VDFREIEARSTIAKNCDWLLSELRKCLPRPRLLVRIEIAGRVFEADVDTDELIRQVTKSLDKHIAKIREEISGASDH
jgi:cell division protein ZapA (FtsZ GTPase activity inhibitor)